MGDGKSTKRRSRPDLAALNKVFKHGPIKHRGTLDHPREYAIWKTMRQRCANPKSKDWDLYGGRGITVCEEWNDFAVFFQHMGKRPEGYALERIDNDKGYGPLNCRWASPTEQANNRRPRRWMKRPVSAANAAISPHVERGDEDGSTKAAHQGP